MFRKEVAYNLVVIWSNCFRTIGLPIDNLDVNFIRHHALNIIKSTPVTYLKESVLHGKLFNNVEDGTISSVNSKFFVDHKEVLGYLHEYVAMGRIWPLGTLLEGHEYFIVVPPKHSYTKNLK